MPTIARLLALTAWIHIDYASFTLTFSFSILQFAVDTKFVAWINTLCNSKSLVFVFFTNFHVCRFYYLVFYIIFIYIYCHLFIYKRQFVSFTLSANTQRHQLSLCATFFNFPYVLSLSTLAHGILLLFSNTACCLCVRVGVRECVLSATVKLLAPTYSSIGKRREKALDMSFSTALPIKQQWRVKLNVVSFTILNGWNGCISLLLQASVFSELQQITLLLSIN